MPDEPQAYQPRCIHLTCRSMQIYGEDFQNDPEFQNGLVEFTCIQTMKPAGPDDQAANLQACSNRERTCFQEY
jgi:hypothetical protein